MKTIAIRSDELHSKLKKLKEEWKLKRYEDVIAKLVSTPLEIGGNGN